LKLKCHYLHVRRNWSVIFAVKHWSIFKTEHVTFWIIPLVFVDSSFVLLCTCVVATSVSSTVHKTFFRCSSNALLSVSLNRFISRGTSAISKCQIVTKWWVFVQLEMMVCGNTVGGLFFIWTYENRKEMHSKVGLDIFIEIRSS
jgi:hypothetical protein